MEAGTTSARRLDNGLRVSSNKIATTTKCGSMKQVFLIEAEFAG